MLQEEAVAQRGQQADRIEVNGAHQHQPLGRERPQRGLGVAPVLADGAVEGREKPGMSRSQHDEVAAGLEMRGGLLQLPPIILDVLKDIDVEQAVKDRALATWSSVPTSTWQFPGRSPRSTPWLSPRARSASGSRQIQASCRGVHKSFVVPPIPAPTSRTSAPRKGSIWRRKYDFQTVAAENNSSSVPTYE